VPRISTRPLFLQFTIRQQFDFSELKLRMGRKEARKTSHEQRSKAFQREFFEHESALLDFCWRQGRPSSENQD